MGACTLCKHRMPSMPILHCKNLYASLIFIINRATELLALFLRPALPPPNAGSIDQRHSSSQSLVCKNDAHRTSSPGERYFFAFSFSNSKNSVSACRRVPNCRATPCRMQTLKKASFNKALNRLICARRIGALPHYVFKRFAMQHIFGSTNSKGPTDGSKPPKR